MRRGRWLAGRRWQFMERWVGYEDGLVRVLVSDKEWFTADEVDEWNAGAGVGKIAGGGGERDRI